MCTDLNNDLFLDPLKLHRDYQELALVIVFPYSKIMNVLCISRKLVCLKYRFFPSENCKSKTQWRKECSKQVNTMHGVCTITKRLNTFTSVQYTSSALRLLPFTFAIVRGLAKCPYIRLILYIYGGSAHQDRHLWWIILLWCHLCVKNSYCLPGK